MQGYFCGGWRICFEDVALGPYFLVLLLHSYEVVSFLSLLGITR